jgi:hypothetical protein
MYIKTQAREAGASPTQRVEKVTSPRLASKARTLEDLSPLLQASVVLPLLRIPAVEWTRERERILALVERSEAVRPPYAVRSSAAREDGEDASHAGEFLSLLNVDAGAALAEAIDRVVASFGAVAEGDEVLLQPMAPDVACSGVVMTGDPRSGLPYVVINFSEGKDTEATTAGRAGVRTFIYVKGKRGAVPRAIDRLGPAIDELDAIFEGRPIDVEFGISRSGTVYLFQARPIVGAGGRAHRPAASFGKVLAEIHARVSRSMEFSRRHLSVDTVFGVMPDWNPAEMIGLKPRPLSFSLYRHLITDRAWSRGRYRLGYRDLRYVPLMHAFGGTPFVDVGASVTSFLPAEVPDATARKIVSQALAQLRENPALHDKIEFGVVPTCYTPTTRSAAWRERFSSLSDGEWDGYVDSLRRITNHVVEPGGALDARQPAIAHLRALVERGPGPERGGLRDVIEPLEMAYTYGTVLFAEVARAAFIATDLLKSLASSGVMSARFIDHVTSRADTIGARLVADFVSLDRGAFLARHGHIRPGTYDITIPRYDEEPERYFDWAVGRPPTRAEAPPGLDDLAADADAAAMDRMFAEHGLSFDSRRFLAFAKDAIRAREEVKYLFSRLVSDALRALGWAGRRYGLDRESLSFLTVQDLQKCVDLHGEERDWLLREIASNKAAWEATLDIRLPDLMTSPDDIYGFGLMETQPTFVTDLTVEAPVATVDEPDLSGRIVFIENADPGFDWIFTRGIRGFVTAYGGENSHMSIRAREFNLPAVIGAGSRYERWRSGQRVRLECRARHVEVLA